MMDSNKRYSAATTIKSMHMSESIIEIEICWISQFSAPESIQFDQAFNPGKNGKTMEILHSQLCYDFRVTKKPRTRASNTPLLCFRVEGFYAS